MVTAGVATHCPYCSLQCGITLTPQPDGSLELVGRADFPVNRGGLCIKGATATELLDHPERLTTPLVRDSRDAPFRPATWDDALDRIAAAITRTQAAHGRDAVGVFGGGGLTNEKAYQFGKFVRVALRSRNIDYNGRFCMSSAVAAGTRAFGMDRGLPFPFDDIPKADVLVLVGSNPADTMPPAMRFLDDGRERGARHVVIDPRRTATAELAHTHLQPVPNTDLLAGQRPAAHRDPGEPGRRGVRRRPHERVRRRAPRRRAPTGRTGSSAPPASPSPTSTTSCAASPPRRPR